MLKAFIARLIARRISQHFSYATLLIGVVAQLMGITLAPEQVSGLITAVSIIIYVLHQLEATPREPDVLNTASSNSK